MSARTLGRLVRYFGLLGVRRSTVDSLLDTAPLASTLRELIAFDQIGSNVDAGALASVAVVATSYAKGDSVVFHHSRPERKVPDDLTRAIRYEPTRLTDVHVQASSAIPVAFPAIRVDKPTSASGWYGDGGVRLNTPIKPALKLGAKRVVVIGLTSSAPPPKPVTGRPDVFDGAGQIVQALLSDQLTQDVSTLVSRNLELAAKPPGTLRARTIWTSWCRTSWWRRATG